MSYGFVNTEHCPGSSMEDQFRARLGARTPKLSPIPADLVNRFATPQDYDNWTSKRYHEWHSTGSNIDLPPIIQG